MDSVHADWTIYTKFYTFLTDGFWRCYTVGWPYTLYKNKPILVAIARRVYIEISFFFKLLSLPKKKIIHIFLSYFFKMNLTDGQQLMQLHHMLGMAANNMQNMRLQLLMLKRIRRRRLRIEKKERECWVKEWVVLRDLIGPHATLLVILQRTVLKITTAISE